MKKHLWQVAGVVCAGVLGTAVVRFGVAYNFGVAMLLGGAFDAAAQLWKHARRPTVAWSTVLRGAFWVLLGVAVSDALPRVQLGDELVAVLAPALLGAAVLTAGAGAFLPPPTRYFSAYVLGVLALIVQFGARGMSPADAIAIRSPLEGDGWTVGNGGRSPFINHHYGLRSQRHALDIVRVGAPALGAPLYAPAAGRIARVIDTFDAPTSQAERRQAPAGNYMSIALDDGRFLLLAHLKKGSIRVHEGQRVAVGDLIAAVGSSGNSSEPHLHIQAQNKPEVSFAPECETYPLTWNGAELRRDDRIPS